MKLRELMNGFTPDPNFAGWVNADDLVLAIDTSLTQDADVNDYEVAQGGIIGIDASLNAQTKDSQFIRAGASTRKTGTQRTFTLTGEQYIGDPFQDFITSLRIKEGVGNAVVVNYVFFNLLNGKGEKGKASVMTNKDSGGQRGGRFGHRSEPE